MKKFSNTETELKKGFLIKKSMYMYSNVPLFIRRKLGTSKTDRGDKI